ncbi:head closure Hc1 [Mycobacterium phage Kugel]|uniref:Head-to-tail stopper n=1 Tax=Mycobacterium phage Kugel TaxID=2923003 RepID=G8IB57_9CAUD|nr:head closure Hc1 [Mycobacterium phage Kugel]AER49951.1 head-to-tail stopper [Mycobacterium phage Kugel]
MSLLDRGGTYASPEDGFDPVTVYPEVTRKDRLGNTLVGPSLTGIETVARFQVQGQSGTSARRAEVDDIGDMTEQVYTMRLPRSFTTELKSGSEVVWRGERWGVFGEPRRYKGSRRIAHLEYTVRRF